MLRNEGNKQQEPRHEFVKIDRKKSLVIRNFSARYFTIGTFIPRSECLQRLVWEAEVKLDLQLCNNLVFATHARLFLNCGTC